MSSVSLVLISHTPLIRGRWGLSCRRLSLAVQHRQEPGPINNSHAVVFVARSALSQQSPCELRALLKGWHDHIVYTVHSPSVYNTLSQVSGIELPLGWHQLRTSRYKTVLISCLSNYIAARVRRKNIYIYQFFGDPRTGSLGREKGSMASSSAGAGTLTTIGRYLGQETPPKGEFAWGLLSCRSSFALAACGTRTQSYRGVLSVLPSLWKSSSSRFWMHPRWARDSHEV